LRGRLGNEAKNDLKLYDSVVLFFYRHHCKNFLIS